MSRTQESGAYLGGIGAMLEVADVCPSCGQIHSARQFGIRHGGPRECPVVVMGSFPLLTSPPAEEISEAVPAPVPLAVPVASTVPRAQETRETPVYLGSLPVRQRVEETRGRSLGLLWLPPPDLGEVL
jgi:hypothetical protein